MSETADKIMLLLVGALAGFVVGMVGHHNGWLHNDAPQHPIAWASTYATHEVTIACSTDFGASEKEAHLRVLFPARQEETGVVCYAEDVWKLLDEARKAAGR